MAAAACEELQVKGGDAVLLSETFNAVLFNNKALDIVQ